MSAPVNGPVLFGVPGKDSSLRQREPLACRRGAAADRCDGCRLPGYIWIHIQLHSVTREMEAEDRAVHILAATDADLECVFRRPGAARRDGFAAPSTGAGGPLPP